MKENEFVFCLKMHQKVYILRIYSKSGKNDKIGGSSYGDPMVILW